MNHSIFLIYTNLLLFIILYTHYYYLFVLLLLSTCRVVVNNTKNYKYKTNEKKNEFQLKSKRCTKIRVLLANANVLPLLNHIIDLYVLFFFLISTNKVEWMEGNLFKWTNYWSGWQIRYFTLKEGILSYYNTQNDSQNGCCRRSFKICMFDING